MDKQKRAKKVGLGVGTLALGVGLLLTDCDVRVLLNEQFATQKTCGKTTDCVYPSGNGEQKYVCEASEQKCRQCVTAKECREGYSAAIVCDSTSGSCRNCEQGAGECSKADANTPICDPGTGQCRACKEKQDCEAEGFVACEGGKCRGCAVNAECTQLSKPVCNGTTKMCQGCQTDGECGTGLCHAGPESLYQGGSVGQCAQKQEVAWVASRAGCVSGDGKSPSQPLCSVDAALADAGVKYVMLVGDGMHTVSAPISREVQLVGKEATAADVKVAPLSVTGSGKLTLRDLSVVDSLKTQVLVKCTGGSVELVNARLDGGARGVEASLSCTEVKVTRSRIENSKGVGLYVGGSAKYTVLNSYVRNCAKTADGYGVMLPTTGSGKFSFNTIRLNGDGSKDGGIDCGPTPKALTNSIISGNLTVSGTQMAGSCTYSKVVVGAGDGTSAQGTIKENPKFVGADALLDPTDTACIDKGDADAAVKDDLFGNARPKGAGPDIGCHEAK